MVLETAHGKFEGDTIKDVEKQARKAERIVAKLEAEKRARQAPAMVRAESQAWNLYRLCSRDEGVPRSFSFRPLGALHTTVTVAKGANSWDDDTLTIETEDGKGTMQVYPRTYMGYIENGAGWAMAIVMRDDKGNPAVYAVGTNEGEAQGAFMWGKVTLEQFNTRKSDSVPS